MKKQKNLLYVLLFAFLMNVFNVQEVKSHVSSINSIYFVRLCVVSAAICVAGFSWIYGLWQSTAREHAANENKKLDIDVNSNNLDVVKTCNEGMFKSFDFENSCADKMLFIAVNIRDLDAIKTCVEVYRANVSMISNRYKRTPLHLAACNGDFDIAKYLILHGADRSTKDIYGRTPLWYAPKESKWVQLFSSK